MSSDDDGEAIVEQESEDAVRLDYLLIETAGRHAAVPLQDVLRIEHLPLSRIEHVGHRPVLNFEGRLLSIEDSGDVLSAAADPDAPVIVVVCRDGNRQVGIAVSHVLDVAAGDSLFEAGTEAQTSGVTLLKKRVTGVVDLGSVEPLPAVSTPAGDLAEVAEVAV
jgi:two-component system, chemotaxis family, sensor kinase CheA